MPLCQQGVIRTVVKTLTIKLEPHQEEWLSRQSRALKRSKGSLLRELIDERQGAKSDGVGPLLRDLCGSLEGSRDLSTRSLKGYGRS